jgi:TFIIF-interacting CTD phosphatase-like protein
MGMWTKLRPGVRDFLRRAAERFELWIYTAGSRTYADVGWALSGGYIEHFELWIYTAGSRTYADESWAWSGGYI